MNFKLQSAYKPSGDQPKAIKELLASLSKKNRFQTLLGVTGSGKTYTMANVIAKLNRPTLVVAHNKTLAAQLVQEFRTFFPNNAVEYFVSYYDYYQPEAYIPFSDTYIEKDSSINEEIERMRSSATASLFSRRDVIIVSSVSCIYGLGNPQNYKKYTIELKKGQQIDQRDLMMKLIDIGYERAEDAGVGVFRSRGSSLEVTSPFKDALYRLSFEGAKLVSIEEHKASTYELINNFNEFTIFPARHFVVSQSEVQSSAPLILEEMKARVKYFLKKNLYLEAERLERRVTQDMTMLKEVGYVSGIENYSRYLTGRKAGEPPYTLLDYFDRDFLTIIDESHVTLPQVRGMYEGDRSRKLNLVKYGFRLPSALDNRPLKFTEFLEKTGQMTFTSATPADFERNNSARIIEQIIRPTGLVDPNLIVRKSRNQIQDVIAQIKKVDPKERVLITTLTKKTAEDLSGYLKENSLKACYLHSDVDTLDRIRILKELREGKYQVLVGVNLLREGLDLPEVSLVAILDADREGFLRNETSLIQTIGRAARNVNGRVLLYAEQMNRSLKKAIYETKRRRKIQVEYNIKHGITPKSIEKKIESIASDIDEPDWEKLPREYKDLASSSDLKSYIKEKEKEMKVLAQNLEFEKAAVLRDEVSVLKKLQ